MTYTRLRLSVRSGAVAATVQIGNVITPSMPLSGSNGTTFTFPAAPPAASSTVTFRKPLAAVESGESTMDVPSANVQSSSATAASESAVRPPSRTRQRLFVPNVIAPPSASVPVPVLYIVLFW